ncbi:MAG: energy-coupling factor ABC transporter ATP-binding protein [Synergistaceae bacterium]|jgi:energy-coupling factor transport system ATP-binding protein|nr:energy-coupling factor ABC transporter ATP-binding protein [Synergistaceae bacterium]
MSINIENLVYSYNLGTPAAAAALHGVSLSVGQGEWVSIVGHTGSGKSTLAQHMNALLMPQGGRVEIDGTEVGPSVKNLRELRRKVGLVFQYPEQQFFAETVREEIAFAPSNWGVGGDELNTCVAEAARIVGLESALLESNPFALSGGQRRRVALASVMAVRPDYLVLDEPTAGLDARGIRELVQLLEDVRRRGVAIVQVTHDLQSALNHSDRILVLEDGRGIALGSPEETASYLLENPVRGLVIPPLVRFSAGLREMGLSLKLTSGQAKIIEALEDARGS